MAHSRIVISIVPSGCRPILTDLANAGFVTSYSHAFSAFVCSMGSAAKLGDYLTEAQAVSAIEENLRGSGTLPMDAYATAER